jgi:hypothetical protein
MNTVELSVRSELLKIAEDLKTIADQGNKTGEALQGFAAETGKMTEKQVKKTETMLGKLRNMSSRVASSMADDFKALMSAAGISEGLKLGGMFRSSIAETFALSDAIRKLSQVFGIAESRFVSFQSNLTKGLGEIGLSSESAVNALKGLSETQVRGEEQLIEYAKLAGQLSSLGGVKGQEGTVAKGIAGVITARGGNVQDVGQAKSVAEDIRKAMSATGQSPTAILQSLEQLIARMPQDLRKSISTKGLINLGTAAAVGGPQSIKFLEEYLGKSPVARKALEARGFRGVVGEGGLNVEKFRGAAQKTIGAFPGDPRLMAQTLGLSEEAAEGFIRLYESLDKVDSAQKKMQTDNRTLESSYLQAMTAGESFNASLNKVKASLATPLSFATNMLTTGLQKAFQTTLDDVIDLLPESASKDLIKGGKKKAEGFIPGALDKSLGATGVVAGAGILTTLLAGGGIKNLLQFGKSKATGIAERTAFEQITGGKVQDVYVVNASEIGQASSGGTTGTGAGLGILGKMMGVLGAGAAGYALGEALNPFITEMSQGTTKEGFKGDAIERLFFRIDQALGGAVSGVNLQPQEPQQSKVRGKGTINLADPASKQPQPEVRVRVTVESKNADLKATAKPTRGAAQ